MGHNLRSVYIWQDKNSLDVLCITWFNTKIELEKNPYIVLLMTASYHLILSQKMIKRNQTASYAKGRKFPLKAILTETSHFNSRFDPCAVTANFCYSVCNVK